MKLKIKRIFGISFLLYGLILSVFTFYACLSEEAAIGHLIYGEGNPEKDADFNTNNLGNPNLIITIDSKTKYQYVRGFGGMDSAWSSPRMNSNEYETLFDPEKIGLNMFRIMLPPNSTNINSSMKNVHKNYIEAVKIANKYDGYVLASPWSPPAAWKSNGSINGGKDVHLKPEHYQDYADYLKSFAQYMADMGAPVYAVSIQNEPNYETTYDGCLWSQQQMRDFFLQTGRFTDGVKGFGGGKEIPTVLTMNGESANHPNINDAALNNATSRAAIDLIGRHTYGNRQNRYALAIDHPTDPKEVWMTENNINSGNESSYPNDSKWNYVWKILNDIDLSIRLNDESAYIWWYSKRFYSLLGDGQYGASEGYILPRGYALSHYAKFAKEKRRIGLTASGTTASGTAISAGLNFNNTFYYADSVSARASAFMSEDGNEISMVLFTPTTTSGTNGINLGVVKIVLPDDFIAASAAGIRSTSKTKAGEQEIILDEGGKYALVKMPAGNILSFRFIRAQD